MKLVVPSSSLVVPGVQVRVSPSTAGSGVRVTSASTGALLSMVTDALTAVPVSVPSSGVTVQVTVSPPTMAP